jgi:small multidrug resistance pump
MWLFLAIVLEVAATVCMKLSNGFHRVVPTALMVALYLASFAPMMWAMRRLDVSVVYAVWSAVGTALITLISMVLFRESLTATKVGALSVIVLGVIMLNLASEERPRDGGGQQVAEATQAKQLR